MGKYLEGIWMDKGETIYTTTEKDGYGLNIKPLVKLIAKYEKMSFDDALDDFEYLWGHKGIFLQYPRKQNYRELAEAIFDSFDIPIDKEEKAFDKFVDDLRLQYKALHEGEPYWYGIKGIHFRSIPAFGDAVVEYEGNEIYDSEVEDYFIENYRDYCEEEGIVDENDEGFEKYMLDHAEEVKDFILDSCVYCEL